MRFETKVNEPTDRSDLFNFRWPINRVDEVVEMKLCNFPPDYIRARLKNNGFVCSCSEVVELVSHMKECGVIQ